MHSSKKCKLATLLGLASLLVGPETWPQSITSATVTPSSVNLGDLIVPGGFKDLTFVVSNVGTSSFYAGVDLNDVDSGRTGDARCIVAGSSAGSVVHPGSVCTFTLRLAARDLDPKGGRGPGSATLVFSFEDFDDCAFPLPGEPLPPVISCPPLVRIAVPLTWTVHDRRAWGAATSRRRDHPRVAAHRLQLLGVLRRVSPSGRHDAGMPLL